MSKMVNSSFLFKYSIVLYFLICIFECPELSKLDFNGSPEDESQQQEIASEEKKQENRVQEHENEQQRENEELQRVEDGMIIFLFEILH